MTFALFILSFAVVFLAVLLWTQQVQSEEAWAVVQHLVLQVQVVNQKENRIMSIGQDIITALQGESALVDKLIALVQTLLGASMISDEEKAAILQAIADEQAKVAAVLPPDTPAAQ